MNVLQAVRQFVKEGGEAVLELHAKASPISLANVSWVVGAQQARFVSGILKIQGENSAQGANGISILDTGMRSGLTPVMTEVVLTWKVSLT